MNVQFILIEFTETLQDAPWIAQVTGMEGRRSVVWMEGDYNKRWKVTKHRFKGKFQEWTDCVDKSSIILRGFDPHISQCYTGVYCHLHLQC